MTNKIEKLTDAQRFALRNPLNTRSVLLAGADALRIIDQRTAALEAAERKAEHNAAGIEFWSMRYTAANDRAEALQERVAKLEAELETAKKQLKSRTAELLKATGAEVLAELARREAVK